MSELVLVTREIKEQRELEQLSPGAAKAATSRGRALPEEPDRFRTAFERDRDRILHSKAFRRLKHKTQVFINPEGDHFVTRLTHTLQVTQIARSLASALGLNEPLTEAICLGHEVGHPPFGHTGEDALTPYVEGEWLHSEQGVRVFECLEPLNLSWEVLDGIRAHTWKVNPPPATQEGWLCRYADRIAYLVHDMNDAVRAGVISVSEIPPDAIDAFGAPGREWVGTMVRAVIDESARVGHIAMAPDVLAAMGRFREFMFARVYLRPEAQRQNRKAVKVLRDLVDFFLANPEQLERGYVDPDSPIKQQVLDYVAGMSDTWALKTHDRLFRPSGLV